MELGFVQGGYLKLLALFVSRGFPIHFTSRTLSWRYNFFKNELDEQVFCSMIPNVQYHLSQHSKGIQFHYHANFTHFKIVANSLPHTHYSDAIWHLKPHHTKVQCNLDLSKLLEPGKNVQILIKVTHWYMHLCIDQGNVFRQWRCLDNQSSDNRGWTVLWNNLATMNCAKPVKSTNFS